MTEREIQALNQAGTFQNLPIDGTLEETHISWVILGKAHVFKIKKPLKLSFLDFSTLARRKKFCERELILNQRFSPIYLNVLPVRKLDGQLSIGEDAGRIVDYAVHMKRLASAKRMDQLLSRGKINSKHIRSLANVVSSFHRSAEKAWVPFDIVKARADFNDLASVSNLVKKYIGAEGVRHIKKSIKWSNSFLNTHARRIEERIELGFCRDVHGDLHSGNIFIYEKPILFDCIEFNDSYRRIDLINEIAFFCMDLDAYGRADLSKLFIKSYQKRLDCLQTDADHRLLIYYKCYRANIRAKVQALSAEQSLGEERAFKFHIKKCRDYLRLMRNYIE